MGSFTHLQRDQLCKISALTAQGVSAGQIARSIGVHRSTIYGEWNRCGGRAHYCEDAAEFDRLMKRAAGADNARRYDEASWASVQRQLDAAWSPRMIDARSRAFAQASAHTDVGAGARAATPGLPETRGSGVMPSASRIYAWAQTQPHAWWTGKRIRRYGPRKLRVTLGNNGAPAEHWRGRLNSIQARPEAINARIEARHWELDTIVGLQRDSARLLVAVERLSLLTRISFLPRCTAQAVADAVAHWRGKSSAQRALFASFTPDQGTEFARLETVFPAEQVFLCHKHSPWEKARVENTNGLIRFYAPKGQAFHQLNDEKVAWIDDQLNNRPRQTLGWQTPNEVASLEIPSCRDS